MSNVTMDDESSMGIPQEEEEEKLEPRVQEVVDLINSISLHYEMSDDSRVYDKGQEAINSVKTLIKDFQKQEIFSVVEHLTIRGLLVRDNYFKDELKIKY